MSGRRFFVVTHRHGFNSFAIYHDELPKPAMLNGARIVYKLELLGKWRSASIDACVAEYLVRKAIGKLPADNTLRALPKRPTARA